MADLKSSYDYIVIGAGIGGLTVASRLSEDANVNVLLVEAGANRMGDPRVETPGFIGLLYGNPEFDWDYMSEPQVCGPEFSLASNLTFRLSGPRQQSTDRPASRPHGRRLLRHELLPNRVSLNRRFCKRHWWFCIQNRAKGSREHAGKFNRASLTVGAPLSWAGRRALT